MNQRSSWHGLVEAVQKPLGFYTLALLVVEAFRAAVLIGANGLDSTQRFTGMLIGVELFLTVVAIVTVLVWKKPERLLGYTLPASFCRGAESA